MAVDGGGGAPWPGLSEPPVAGRGKTMWPGTNGRQDGGPRRWLPAVLWLLCGAIIGAILTVALLFVAGPRAVPAPTASGSGHVTVTMDDVFLTSVMQGAAGSMPLASGITALTAHVSSGDRIVLAGTSAAGPVSMTLQPLASNGVLSVHVLDARVGGLTLPALVDTQIESAINARLASLIPSSLGGSSHYVVSSLATSDGHLTLTLGPAS